MRVGQVNDRFVVVEQVLCRYRQFVRLFAFLVVAGHDTEVMDVVERLFIIGIDVESLISCLETGFLQRVGITCYGTLFSIRSGLVDGFHVVRLVLVVLVTRVVAFDGKTGKRS